MKIAAIRLDGGTSPGAARLCRECGTAVSVQGDQAYGRVIHASTGQETGDGGHLVTAPEMGGLLGALADDCGIVR